MNPDWSKLRKLGFEQLGKPYQFGFKPADSDPNPKEFDCSGLTKWLFAQIGVHIPDGSQNQFEASVPVSDPQFGDLCFLAHPGAPTHHVGVVWDDGMVLEDHGSAVWDSEPKFQVVLRPQSRWEEQPDFAGYRRLKQI